MAKTGSFRLQRIITWMHPEENQDEGGYQVMQGLYAIGSGGFVSYTEKIRRYSGDIPMCFANYSCSEAMIAVVTEVESFDYTLIPMGAYYEFLPPG